MTTAFNLSQLSQPEGSTHVGHKSSLTGSVDTTVANKLKEICNIKADFGVVGNGIVDDTAAIQAAMDAFDDVVLPPGTYKITTLRFKRNNQKLRGSGFGNTTISSVTSGTGSSIIANNTPGTTLIGCELTDIKVVAGSLAIGFVVDWQHIQLGKIERVWVYGGGNNCTGFALGATWSVTECTYNTVIGCYVGNVLKGFSFGDGANSNTIINCRAQPGYAGGHGFFLFGTAAGRISNNVFIGGGTEYPGNISGGFYLGQGSDSTVVTGHRFESLGTAIDVQSTALDSYLIGNYFSSNTFTVLDAGTRTIRQDVGGIYIGPNKVLGARETGWTTGTGTANKGAFTTYNGATMSVAYVQAEAQATNDAAKNASQRIKAIEDALRTHGLIS